ncbi:unnamed protein product [Tuber melanosporum]|uniref:(Perigord truffle) hypothetical protein n=1 Tax=Tuber melanosporum (strain Mel28) TaxID=656061 RepID=D5GHD3_TUBMM|nr:uncharacterized protein GSTUM_00007811001 [Tuber melanosporum]CAZ83926.1 unnamed protein product [Tuber melanosporum]
MRRERAKRLRFGLENPLRVSPPTDVLFLFCFFLLPFLFPSDRLAFFIILPSFASTPHRLCCSLLPPTTLLPKLSSLLPRYAHHAMLLPHNARPPLGVG